MPNLMRPVRRAALRVDPGGFWSRPQDPIVVGRLVVDDILNNDLFIFPAPEYRQGVESTRVRHARFHGVLRARAGERPGWH